jgi:hypothetical protein
MNTEEKICPYIKEPCVGKKCSEFIPRHTYIEEYGGCGIQDFVIDIWCLICGKKYPIHTYKETMVAYCRLNIRSARDVWDKDEFKEDWTMEMNKK